MSGNSEDDPSTQTMEALLATPSLAEALDNEHFRRFLDQIPIALILAAMRDGEEHIIYANPEFTRMTGRAVEDVLGKPWSILTDLDAGPESLGAVIPVGCDALGTFRVIREGAEPVMADAYANVIEDEAGRPAFRLAALVDVTAHRNPEQEGLAQALKDKDVLLREVQHRVKNNLQMITALIRIEARNAARAPDPSAFARLAGRIEAIQLLYDLLSGQEDAGEVDLGIYLTRLASAVLKSQGAEGIRLNCQVDVYPVPVNIAMPTGLVVNELLTNALKHAFEGRDNGTITLQSLTDGEACLILVADDGRGMPESMEWPQRGKLSYAIVQSLKENAHAAIGVSSVSGQGTRVTIRFTRRDAAKG